jgi:hypothetical protein
MASSCDGLVELLRVQVQHCNRCAMVENVTCSVLGAGSSGRRAGSVSGGRDNIANQKGRIFLDKPVSLHDRNDTAFEQNNILLDSYMDIATSCRSLEGKKRIVVKFLLPIVRQFAVG